MNYPRATTVSFQYEKRVIAGITALLLGLAALYTYFVMMSIAAVVEREELAQNITQRADAVASLEREYLARSHQLSETVAYQSGYVAAHHRLYVERGTLTLLSNAR